MEFVQEIHLWTILFSSELADVYVYGLVMMITISSSVLYIGLCVVHILVKLSFKLHEIT
jgi:hypothetical protein